MDKIKSYFLRLLFPTQICSFCGKEINNIDSGEVVFTVPNICLKCLKKFELPDVPYCYHCHKPLKDLLYIGGEPICKDCIKYYKTNYFVFNRSATLYTEFVKDLLALYKYRGKESLAIEFSYLLKIAYDSYFKDIEIDCLTYVPLHNERLRERGFNQAEKMTKNIQSLIGIQTLDLLVKIKNTEKLSRTQKKERLEQVRGAYALKEEVQKKVTGKSILLIDDIYTTGVTINECSMLLKNAGAKKIYSLTLARAYDIG